MKFETKAIWIEQAPDKTTGASILKFIKCV